MSITRATVGSTGATIQRSGQPIRSAPPTNGPMPKNGPVPARDGVSLSREADKGPEGQSNFRAGSLSAALQENFGSFDANEDGHITNAEVTSSLESETLTWNERAALTALSGQQSDLEEASNDEWGDENDGFTPSDIAAFESTQNSKPVLEEFHLQRNRKPE